jgi:uncharacterized protein (TIGR02001 family)
MKILALLSAALFLTTTSAHAVEVGYTAAVASRYVSRGTDQNVNGDPALELGVNVSKGNFYFNTFAANMNFGEGTKKELDFFAGYKPTIKNTTLTFQVASINYPMNHSAWNFVEYEFGADHSLGKGSVGAFVGYTDSYFAVYGPGTWTEVHASYPLTNKIGVSASFGHQALRNNFDYNTWNVGATYAMNKHLSLDVRYSDTDRHDLDPIYNTYGNRLAMVLTASF